MAESTDAKEASSAQAAPSSSRGSKLIVILALVNFIAVLAMGGYIFYTRQQASAQAERAKGELAAAHRGGDKAAEGEHGADDAEGQAGEHEASTKAQGGKAAGKAAGGPGKEDEVASPHGDESAGGGPLLALDPMVTNLAEPDSDRYLKVGMQVRLTSEAARPEVESQLVPVRNQILLYLSSLTIADTSGADNKRAIQKTVKRVANEAMRSSRITQVYFSEFVIQ